VTLAPRRGGIPNFTESNNRRRLKARGAGASRLAYRFEGTEPLDFFEPPRVPARPCRRYHNPVILAHEWQSTLAQGSAARGPTSLAGSG